MLRLINTIIALVVLSTLSYSQEVVCQNGRCDVVKKVAAVAVAPVVSVSNIVRNDSQTVSHRTSKPQTKRCFFKHRKFRL